MWALLSGRLTALKTALGTPASSTVAAKVDTLHDTRLTSLRAGYLDLLNSNLDAPISGIASDPKPEWTKVPFTSDGSFTVPAGTGWMICYIIACAGGGGGGKGDAGDGGGGGGGGEGCYLYPVLVDRAGGNIAVTVGAGGSLASANISAGGDGGATSFGSLLTLAGGLAGLGTGGTDPGSGAGGNGSNGTYLGATNDTTEGGEPESAQEFGWGSVGIIHAQQLMVPWWRRDGSGGGCGSQSAGNGGNSGDSFSRVYPTNASTAIAVGVPAGAYEGGAGGSSCFGTGGKREGISGTTNVVTPVLGGGGSGGVGTVINSQPGGAGFLDVWYWL